VTGENVRSRDRELKNVGKGEKVREEKTKYSRIRKKRSQRMGSERRRARGIRTKLSTDGGLTWVTDNGRKAY